MEKIAVFPGSFDPITVGHADILERALPLFDRVFIALGNNYEKKYLFTVDKREEWLKNIYAGNDKLKVIRYDGLTIAEAAILDAHVAASFYSPDEGSAYGFNFRHHIAGDTWSSTAGTLYANCHYSPGGYSKSHTHTGSQAREIVVEKRP